MAFELFNIKNKRGLEPKITIRPNGQIYFNVGAIIRFKLTEFKYVQLFYDKELSKIGIKLTIAEDAQGKLTLVAKQDASSGWVSAKTFFNFFNIRLPPKESGKGEQVEFSFDEQENMIVIQYPNVSKGMDLI